MTVDAMRGLASFMVLMYHARGMFWQGNRLTYQQFGLAPNLTSWPGYATTIFNPGFLGVTLFFVLSGYCVHRKGAHMLARDPGATLDLKAYALRRAWRIYPVYIAALLVTAAVDMHVRNSVGLLEPAQDNSAWAFVSSLLTLQGYVTRYFGSNGVFWTLSMEVHFYILYPLLFAVTRRYGPQRTLLLTGVLSIGYVIADLALGLTRLFPYAGLRGPVLLPYWFTWTLGFYLAEMEARRIPAFSHRLRVPVVIVLAGLGGVFNLLQVHSAAELCWAIVFTAFVHWSLGPSGRARWSARAGRLMARLGVFSYSLYAIHAPVLLFVSLWWFDTWPKPASVLHLIAAAALTIAVSWVFFHLIERWTLTPLGGAPRNAALEHAAP